jgi:hypothetical protein
MRSLYSVSSATSHSSLFTPQIQPLEVVRGASLAHLKGELDADRRAEGAARWLDGDLLVLPTITQAGSVFNTYHAAIVEARGHGGSSPKPSFWLKLVACGFEHCSDVDRAVFAGAYEAGLWRALERATDKHND